MHAILQVDVSVQYFLRSDTKGHDADGIAMCHYSRKLLLSRHMKFDPKFVGLRLGHFTKHSRVKMFSKLKFQVLTKQTFIQNLLISRFCHFNANTITERKCYQIKLDLKFVDLGPSYFKANTVPEIRYCRTKMFPELKI